MRFCYFYDQKFGNKLGESYSRDDKKVETSRIDIEQQLSQTLENNPGIGKSSAFFLSGGIDSPLIVAIAQSLSPKPLKAFTFSTQDKTTDETAFWTRWNEFSGHMQASLTKTRMASSAAGSRVEAPFLDQKLIELAGGLNWRTCLDLENEVGKIPLRELLGEYVRLPSEGKLGFNVPMNCWLRGPLRGMFEETVLNRDALMGLEINRKVMRKHFDDLLSGKMDRSWGLWIFLSLAIWEDVHQGK